MVARTALDAHRVLSKALQNAVRYDLTIRNVAAVEGAPRSETKEVEILTAEQFHDVTTKLAGHPIYAAAITSLCTGLRRGELLALKWNRVDLDRNVVEVREALEETQAHGIRFKVCKTA